MRFTVVLHFEGYARRVEDGDWHVLADGEEYYSEPYAGNDPVFTEVFVTTVEAEDVPAALALGRQAWCKRQNKP